MIRTRYWNVRRRLSLARHGNRIYSSDFKALKIAFVHIPKCAGTSIANALYGRDPWHYTAQEYAKAEPNHWNNAFKFSVVRNPITRFESSFYYAREDVRKYRASSLKFVLNYRDINEFVSHVTAKNLLRHPFFWEQSKYLFDRNQRLMVDFVGRFENVCQDFATAMKLAGLNLRLDHLNTSPVSTTQRMALDERSIEILHRAYQQDFESFGYE